VAAAVKMKVVAVQAATLVVKAKQVRLVVIMLS
jgi:hypothetical protein